MWYRFVVVGFFVGVSLACFAPCVSTAAPAVAPKTSAGGRSGHDLLREIAAFDQKYVVEAYEKIGHRDAKWDDAADKLVHTQYGASLWNNDVGGYYVPPDSVPMTPLEDRVKLAEEVLATDCDDPMVLFLAGSVLDEAGGHFEKCNDAFLRADKAVDASKYIPLYKMIITYTGLQHVPPLDEGDTTLAAWRERFRAFLRDTLSDKETLPANRAVVWHKGHSVFEEEDGTVADRIGTAVANARDPDPWLFDTYMGGVEIRRAWLARGSGWADSVTQDGWKKFALHLAKARELLQRASDTDKTLPHAPALMVTVALGESSGDGGKWFRKAVARQVDWKPAYGNYRSIVQPRWGGSVQQQIDLAKFMLDTDRYDTCVPGLVLEIVSDLEIDAGQPLPRRLLDEVAPLVDEAMAGYAEQNKLDNVRSWANAERVTWLCLREDWKGARAQLDTMVSLEQAPCAEQNLEGREVIGHVFAMTSPQADAIRAAMSETDATARLAQLKEVAAAMTDDEAAAKSVQSLRAKSAINWTQRRIAETEFEASLKPGEWTSMPIAPDLQGWIVERGQWKADGDTLVGTCDNGLNIIAPFTLPDRYELRCTVEVVGDAHPNLKSIYVTPAWAPRNGVGARVNLADGQSMLIYRGFDYGKFSVAREGDAATLTFRYDRGQFTALDEADAPLATNKFDFNPIRRPAFGGTFQDGGGVTWRFSGIQVRTLK